MAKIERLPSGTYRTRLSFTRGGKQDRIKLSRVPNQREFLLDKGLTYRIKSKKGNNIILEVVKTWK